MTGSRVRFLCAHAWFFNKTGTVLAESTYERSQGRDRPPVKEFWLCVSVPDSDPRLRWWRATRVWVLKGEVRVIGT